MPDSNQNNSNNNSNTVSGMPIVPPITDTPPLPPDFLNVPPETPTSPQNSDQTTMPPVIPVPITGTQPTNNSGSAAPSDLPPVITPPKKKFGGGRVIATILGLFLLVGGIGAGIVLTNQQQLFEQKADSGVAYCGDGICNENAQGCSRDCGTGLINCGGVQCAAQDCHCQGGDACTSLRCEPDIRESCERQGRAWCSNMQSGAGMTCCVEGYVCYPGGQGCVPGGGSNPPGSGTPRPTGTPNPTASCQSIKAYSSTWTLLTAANLSNLARGTSINFCVTGTTTTGSFDRARFTINGAAPIETTTQRPNTSDYCTAYTIPATGNAFNVTADIHHVSLGWK